MRPVRTADNLATFMCRLYRKWGTSTFGALRVYPGLLMDRFTFSFDLTRYCHSCVKKVK